MGKISNAIQMLNYLNTGNKYSVKELSMRLGITERMVRYYKVELEQAGIPIETFMGPNGGYYIINTTNQYNQFNKYDLQLLENIYDNLSENEYEYLEKYSKLIDKIKYASDVIEEKSSKPKICWGKYYLEEDKYMIDISILVNHAFQDGYHIGLFFNELQRNIYNIEVQKKLIRRKGTKC